MRRLVFAILVLLAAQLAVAVEPAASYKVVVLEKFTVAPEVLNKDFPADYETVLQKSLFARLVTEQLFEQVVNAATAAPSADQDSSSRLIVSGTVIDFDKGSRSKRLWVGMGAGAAKIKVRLVFREAASGKTVCTVEQQGKFYGMDSSLGGKEEHARTQAATDVINSLMKEIKKNFTVPGQKAGS